MRLTRAQLAVHQICGVEPGMKTGKSRRRMIQEGRLSLRTITGMDFGYDLQKWHDYLKESREGGYTWNRTIDLPKIMKEALEDNEWLEAVRVIELAEESPL